MFLLFGKYRQTSSMYRIRIAVMLVIALVSYSYCLAQQNPPHPIKIYSYPEQGLQFGAFCQGIIGGTVIITPDGSRTTTGDIVQLSLGHLFSAAFFEVEGEPGTRVTILKGSDVILLGNTGGTLTLELGDSDPLSPFIITSGPPSRTQVRIGGTLHVGSPLANPPGNYNGTVSITFIQE
jgi:hypothetical protein